MTPGWWVYLGGEAISGPWLCEKEAQYRIKRVEGSTYEKVEG